MAYTEDVNINLNVLAGAMGGITAITSGMSAMTSTFGEFGTEAAGAFGQIDALLVTSTALVASFGAKAAEAYGEFEQGMKIVQAVSGQTGYAINELTNKANEMSITYRTAIGDITEGLQTLGRAGLNSAETQLDVLESGLQTAKLEGRNLNGVLEEIIQNTAMLGGDLKSIDFGSQSEYLNSLMVGTSMTAPINSHDISQTLQYAGGTAAAAGADLEHKDKLEDLMGTIAAFAQKGVSGSMAGTALRAFFTKPASQDASVTEGLSRIGLTPERLWENGGESMKKVSDQIGIIQRQMDSLDLSKMDQIEIWGKIVGPKMGQQMMKLDSSTIKDLTKDIESAQSAESLAAETLQTYTQQIAEMQQQGEMAFRQFGANAARAIAPIIEGLTLIFKFFSNPWVSATGFSAALALFGHGIRAAWGMIKSVASQIMSLIRNIEVGMANLAGAPDGLTSGLSRSAGQAELLNSKLVETNSTLQAIQAKSMNIQGINWKPNGGRIGDKASRGAVSSMKQDIIIGGTLSNGMKVGEPGKYYSSDKKQEFRESLIETSEKNKEAQEKYVKQQEEITATTNKLRNRLAEVNHSLITQENKAKNLLDTSSAITGNDQTSLRGALLNLSMQGTNIKSELNSNESLKQRNAFLEQYQVTEEEIAATQALSKAERELAAKLREEEKSFLQSERKRLNQYVKDNHAKYQKGDDEYIENPHAYIEQSLTGDKEESSVNKFAKAHQQEFSKLEEMRNRLNTTKSQQILKAPKVDSNIAALEQKYGEIIALQDEIKEELEWRSRNDIDNFIANLEAEKAELLAKIQASEARNILGADELEALMPTASKSQINTMMKELNSEVQTEFRVMEENAYKAEMARLKSAAKYSPIAALSYSQNKELEKAMLSKIEGTNYRQVATNTPVKPKGSAIVEQARTTMKNGIAKEMADAMAIATNKANKAMASQGAFRGSSSMYNKAQQKGISILNSYTDKVRAASNALSGFRQSVEIWRNGLPSVAESAKSTIMGVAETNAMAGMEFEAAMSELSAATGLNAIHLSELALQEGMAGEEIITAVASMVAATDEEIIAIEQEIRARMANILSMEGEAGAKGLGGILKGAGQSVMGFMGGPFMALTMGFTFLTQAINDSRQKWQEAMQEASSQVSEASSKLTEASDKIKDIYKSENDNITEADLDKAVDEQYATVAETFYGMNGIGHYESDRDDLGRAEFESDIDISAKKNEETGELEMLTAEQIDEQQNAVENITLAKDENIKALNENTMALVSATNAYNDGILKEAKAFNDGTWGFNSFTAQATDQLGEWQEEIWNVGAWLNEVDAREGFLDSNSPVLTGSQKDKDYAGSKEFAGIFAADTLRFGTEQGLRQFFGSDYDRIIGLMGSMDSKIGAGTIDSRAALNAHAQNMANMSPEQMALGQMHLKENKEDFQKLAKQMFRYEQRSGFKRSAMDDWQTGTLKPQIGLPSGAKAFLKLDKKKWTVQDRNLDRTLKKIMAMTDNKLSYANILALGSLQQLQDMYQVANETVAPGIMNTVQGVYQNVNATGAAASNAGNASEGANSAAANAGIIASLLGAQAQGAAETAAYDQWKRDPDAPKTINGIAINNQDDFVKAISKGGEEGNKWQERIFSSLGGSGWAVNHPGASQDMINLHGHRLAGDVMKSDANYQDKLNTITKPLVNFAQGSVMAAYDQSKLGEYGGGSHDTGSGGGGGGGDGGGGSGDSGSNEGTKKSRVDLVLCNKKEIPKLNVNLFKTPPNFTILNKNFKLRDIKINSQDKPKAIMAAVKNGIIETQKRMDPKIIQDESGEYDPLAATEGKATPSGNTPTSSSSSNSN